ncbi:MAG: histone deacetylase [Elusimicrobiota bacterium]
MKIVFSSDYTVSNCRHIFRTDKFSAVLKLLLEEGLVTKKEIIEPKPPSRADLMLAHTPAWVDKNLRFKFTPLDSARAELDITRGVARAHLMNVGGTIAAARLALETGLGINCGGGSHHAFKGHGEGFCLLNDVAVAVKKLQAEKSIKRALIVDLDVHQGNGTASVFKKDKNIFTFSMHQRDIYPKVREKSSFDLELPAGTGDAEYLKILRNILPEIFNKARADVVVYNSGADIYEHDMLGGLKLTMAGVAARDKMVFSECFGRKTPVILVLSGGYARKFSDTVRLHANTIITAVALWKNIGLKT